MSASQRSLPGFMAVVLVALALGRIAVELVPGLRDAGMEDGLIEWRSHEDALEESARTGRPILLEFSTDWCAPCRRMDAETWSDERVAETVARHFIPVRLVHSKDPARNRPADEALRQAHGVEAFPTLLVVLPGDLGAERSVGFLSPADAMRFLDDAALRHLAARSARRRLSGSPPASPSR